MKYLKLESNGIDIIWSDYSTASVFKVIEQATNAAMLSGGEVVKDYSGQFLVRKA